MIPIIYESTETSFVSNGLGRLRDCITCKVTEERNGVYECEFTYPVSGANFDLIQPGRIVGVTHDETGDLQPFEIVSYTKPIDGIVTFHAVHISYRLGGMVTWSRSINSLTAAMNLLNGISGSGFTFSADFTSSGFMAAADGVPRTVRQLLGGIEGSILDTYGGEYEFNRFQVTLHKARGQARDFTIRYGVNLLDYSEEADYSGTYTSCIPYWTGMDGAKQVVVRGSRVDSNLTPYNGRRTVVPLDLTDKFEDKPTASDLQTMAATLMKARQPNLPAQNIKVDFIRLQDMAEFEDFASLLQCNLCDTINVVFPRYGMSGVFKIVRTVWDVLADRYEEMELGTLSTSLAEALGISETAGSYATTDDLGVAGNLAVGGTITSAGHIYAEGHGTWIGYQTDRYEGTANMATGTTWVTTGRTLSLGAGTWIVEGSIAYDANTTGRRGAEIYVDGIGNITASQQTQNATSAGVTRVATSATVVLTASTVVRLYGFQNSGGQLSQTSYFVATRIA